MFSRFAKPSFSPVELEYLKTHQNDPQAQLCIALGKSANAIKNKLYELANGVPHPSQKKSGKRTNIGKRTDLKLFLRSSWEANFLRYLKHEGIKYEYEPRVFHFEGIKHGTVSYCPDIYLPELDVWLEVKGQLLAKDRVRIRRFKKYFPEEYAKLQGIPGRASTKAGLFFTEMGIPIYKCYTDLDKQFKKVIKNWE